MDSWRRQPADDFRPVTGSASRQLDRRHAQPPSSVAAGGQAPVTTVNRFAALDPDAQALPRPVFGAGRSLGNPMPTIMEVQWLHNRGNPTKGLRPDIATVESEDSLDIDYDLFGDRQLMQRILDGKSKLGQALTDNHLKRARTMTNPYDRIGKTIFINRAAVKLAEIDAACGLTSNLPPPPSSPTSSTSTPGYPPTVIADLCSGPGGFSEYLLWRTHHDARDDVTAVGFTQNPPPAENVDPEYLESIRFWADKFHPLANAAHRFVTHYGLDVNQGSGNIMDLANVHGLAAYIDSRTRGQGAMLVTSDGGISVRGNEHRQEVLTRHLKLCEVLCALHVLARNGQLVLKVYDVASPFMAGLVYLIHCCFRRVALTKPLSSRPANSERYVVAQGLLERRPANVIEALEQVHERMLSGECVSEIVNVAEMFAGGFREYLVGVNKLHAQTQAEALEALVGALPETADESAGGRGACGKGAGETGLVRACLQRWKLWEHVKGGAMGGR
ncbi:FtsJ-like methyltransferase-domain-containing protein [Catenaria anguillulae PL171]|uniref:Cap-specific mRNA (nucleoside-2'-O-)-methyltransferase 1 n=1 Tax=Catenaria anguillulae PL171 TaxID=765915 RepID=A0A1Y2HVF2_9FUNG|nr:FtsJ-like methyltransferase-domain-containing protein [Catenaria anguillulae PL171]